MTEERGTSRPNIRVATPEQSGEQLSLIGSVINGRYKILQRVAAGGMGVVYKAEQIPLGRAVAFKVLQTQAADDPETTGAFRTRFFREAAASARLSHPNIVTVFDYGVANDDLVFIAMEFLEGRTLQKELATQGPLSPARALRIALQVCSGLREAHAAGMVHRDLKPGNVMLLPRGVEGDLVKILDFGLVKLSDTPAELDLTNTGAILGSPRFMSPEQVQCVPVDHRSDIYSFGAMLFNMLAGKPPFNHAASFKILSAHVNDPPPPLREYFPQCEASPRLEALVRRCLEKAPEARPQTMDDVLAELQLCFDELGLSTATLLSLPVASSLSNTMTGLRNSAIVPSRVSTTTGVSAAGAVTTRDALAAPSAAPRVSLGILLGGVGLLAAVGALAGTVFARSSRHAAAATPSASASASARAGIDPRAALTASANPTASASTAAVPVRLLSDPAVARVRRDGNDLGDTPLALVIPAGAEWAIEVAARGYETRTVRVSAGQGEVTVRLERAREGSTTRVSVPRRGPSAPHGETPGEEPAPRRATDNRDPWAE